MAIHEVDDPAYEKKHGKKLSYYIDDRLKAKSDEKIKKVIDYKDKDFFAIVDGGEGCFFEDTIIKTTEGNKSIKELVAKNNFVANTIGINFKTNKKEINKSKIIPSGEREVYEIETVDGRIIQATLEHKFFVERNGLIKEIRLKSLKIGDKLICEKK
jgi:hypothetical protein